MKPHNLPVIVYLSFLACTAAVAFEDAGEASAVGCPGSATCCAVHGSPGCNNSSCCQEVCGIQPTCCDTAWHQECVDFANTFCGDLCSNNCPTTGDCCAAHENGGCGDGLCCDLVCTARPACCDGTWSAACADLAIQICDVCEPPFECPQPGDCCAAQSGTGCDRAACCEIVCNLDSFCCRGKWDSVCANKARINCPNVCACDSFGNVDPAPAIDLLDVAAYFNCFSGSGSPDVPEPCACSDYNGDGDSDLLDFAAFSLLLTSP